MNHHFTYSKPLFPLQLLIILLLLLPTPGGAIGAHQYTARNFEVIRRTRYPHFVMFYAPWCTHCSSIADIWEEFATTNHDKGRMKVAKVDCTTDTKICAAENIKAYPTFLLYTAHDKHVYRGTRHGSYFLKFVRSVVPDLRDHQVPKGETRQVDSEPRKDEEDTTPALPKVLTRETFADEIDKDYTFVDFFAPWCSHCVKFEPTWNKLADTLKYNDKVTVAKVDCTADPELCKQSGITGYPTLKLYKNGVVLDHYRQDRSLASLVEFMQFHLSDENEFHSDQNDPNGQDGHNEDPVGPPNDHLGKDDDDNDENSEDDTTDQQGSRNAGKLVKLTDDTFHEVLSLRPHLLYFHSHGSRVSRMEVEVMKHVAQRLRFLNHDVGVAVVDCTVAEGVCNHFSMQDDGEHGAVVMFVAQSLAASHFDKILDVDNLVDFVLLNKQYQSDKDEL